MKKAIYTIAMIVIGTGVSMAAKTNSDLTEKDKKDSAKVEETKAAELSFLTDYSSESRQLIVDIAGNMDPYASVSVTNARGTSIQCSFIQEASGKYTFDLSKLSKGIYNVMLITDKEIRIKKIQVG